jgi:Carbohydrate-binding module 48 (Isoamylase N-terminal domain)
MSDNEKPDFAREVHEAYMRTAAGDDAAPQRLLERLGEAPPPRRTPAWWRGLAAHGTGWQRAALVAAGLLALVGGGLVVGTSRTRVLQEAVTPDDRPATELGRAMVRFELHAPGARQVALVGDFNDWDPAATLMRREASRDNWSVSLPVSHGRHVYGFVVDRHRWLPDPGAPLAPEDGFGSANSVIIVAGTGS